MVAHNCEDERTFTLKKVPDRSKDAVSAVRSLQDQKRRHQFGRTSAPPDRNPNRRNGATTRLPLPKPLLATSAEDGMTLIFILSTLKL